MRYTCWQYIDIIKLLVDIVINLLFIYLQRVLGGLQKGRWFEQCSECDI